MTDAADERSLPAPGPLTRQAIDDAHARQAERRQPVEMAVGVRDNPGEEGGGVTRTITYGCPHNDAEGWAAMRKEAMGTRSASFATHTFESAMGVVGKEKDAARAVNATLALFSGIEPRNELEGALAGQMVAVNALAMDAMGKAATAPHPDARERFINQANKLTRTFAAQLETLQKLRTGGKQQVEVRYVYVDARTQTVVNPAIGQGGAGYFGEQPLAPGALGAPLATGLPVRGHDASGLVVPFAGCEGAQAVPDARGTEPRRSEGSEERKLSVRMLDGGDDLRAADDQSTGETSERDAA